MRFEFISNFASEKFGYPSKLGSVEVKIINYIHFQTNILGKDMNAFIIQLWAK